MRTQPEIQKEYQTKCIQLGDLYVKREGLSSQIHDVLEKIQALFAELNARQAFEAEKAKEREEELKKKDQDQANSEEASQLEVGSNESDLSAGAVTEGQ